jgi:hypothetical protein
MKLDDLADTITYRIHPPGDDWKASVVEVLECLADLSVENERFAMDLHHSLIVAGIKRKEIRNGRTEDRRDQDQSQHQGEEPTDPPGQPLRRGEPLGLDGARGVNGPPEAAQPATRNGDHREDPEQK